VLEAMLATKQWPFPFNLSKCHQQVLAAAWEDHVVTDQCSTFLLALIFF